MTMAGVLQIGLGVGFCGCAILAFLALWREAPAVLYDTAQAPAVVLRAESMPTMAAPPRSLRLQQRLLAECDEVLVSPHLTLASQVAADRIIERCLGVSEAVLRDASTSSFAYLVRAEASHRRGKAQTVVWQAYERSVALGPYEAWLAARRLRFAVPLWPVGDPQVADLIAQDFQLVASAAPYRPLIAELYLAQPQARMWVKAQLAQVAPQDQQAVVKDLKRRGGAGD